MSIREQYLKYKKSGYKASELYTIISEGHVIISPREILENMLPGCPDHMREWVEKLMEMSGNDKELRVLVESQGIVELLKVKIDEWEMN